jgi:hypothetical protein
MRSLWDHPQPSGPPTPRGSGGHVSPYRARLYRGILLLAAAYNAAFGLWAGFWPRSFFDVFGLAQPTYPAIWRCLGMVVGVYGLLYAYAALRLELARPYVVVGLLGKVLGPIGWLVTVNSGEWPARTFTLIVFNDLIWWVPFALFLLEGTRLGQRLRSAAPFICAGLNLLGGAALALVLRPGTEVAPDPLARAAYIAQHLAPWRGGWLVWMAAALSLLGFYAWWGGQPAMPRWAVWGIGLAAAGIVFDFLAESLYIGWLPEHLESIQRLGTLLSGGLANGFYTFGGIALTAATPWDRLPRRPGLVRGLAWAAWLSGIALSLSAVFNFVPGLVLSGAALIICFCPFAVLMGLNYP